jgi:penicillin-binding protein 1C
MANPSSKVVLITGGSSGIGRAAAVAFAKSGVRAAQSVGPPAVLEVLRRFGFTSLGRDPGHYGAAIALGSGEVRLAELAQAYSALARDGELLPLRYVTRAELDTGGGVELERATGRRVLEPRFARQLTSVLADDSARSESFGSASVLSFPFPAAAKTGTSKGFRDNWAVGYTREFTVAVWAGNFDGRPMVRSSGVSGAGPLMHAVLMAAMRGVNPEPLVRTDGLVAAAVCALSGVLPGPACPHRVTEYFVPDRAPRAACSMHELVAIDRMSGLRAGASCAGTELVSFERYAEADRAWAEAAARPLAPAGFSARCPR